MEGIVGVFRSRDDAEHAVNDLRRMGQPEDSIVFLTPHASEAQLAEVPTTNAESPGIGKGISTVVGGAIGGGAGLGIGSALASLFVPGIGPILAAGIGAGALLGIGGAAAGAAIGEATEESLDTGIPIDDLSRLRFLLKSGRTLVVVSADSKEKEEQLHALFNSYNAEPFHHSWDFDRAA
jgi:hypothetical protein